MYKNDFNIILTQSIRKRDTKKTSNLKNISNYLEVIFFIHTFGHPI